MGRQWNGLGDQRHWHSTGSWSPQICEGSFQGRLSWPWVWLGAFLINSVYLQTQIRPLGRLSKGQRGVCFSLHEIAKCLIHIGVTS